MKLKFATPFLALSRLCIANAVAETYPPSCPHCIEIGIENLGISAICAIMSTIIFTKGLPSTPPAPPPSPVNENEFKEESEAFAPLFAQLQSISKQSRDERVYFSMAEHYYEDQACREALKKTFVPNLTKRSDPERTHLYECYSKKMGYSQFENKYAATRKVKQFIDHFQETYKQDSISYQSKETDLTISQPPPVVENEEDITRLAYFKYQMHVIPAEFKAQRDEIISKFAPLKNMSGARFTHFVETKMKQQYGPFLVHLQEACDKSLFDQIPLQTHLNEKYCTNYFKMKEEHQEVLDYAKALYSINPDQFFTNANWDVFEPFLDHVIRNPDPYQHLAFGLTKEQFEAWKILRAELYVPPTPPTPKNNPFSQNTNL